MMYTNTSSLQVLCDGKKFVVIHQDGEHQLAYILEQPIVSELRYDIKNGVEPMHYANKIVHIPTAQTYTLDLSLLGNKMRYMSGTDLLLDMDMFDDYTITDLFKVINRKIDKRE